jgi:hypothetical protein
MTLNETVHPMAGYPEGGRAQPAVTRRQAVRARLCTRRVYDYLVTLFDLVADYYKPYSVPRSQCEPPQSVVHKLAEPHISAARAALTRGLSANVQPVLQRISDTLGSAQNMLGYLSSWSSRFSSVSIETGTVRGLTQAIADALQLTSIIRRDRATGLTHHRRTSRTFLAVATKLPFAEAIGALAFFSYKENIDFLNPLSNPLGWTAASIILVVVLLLQTRAVTRAAEEHNRFREQRAVGSRASAEEAHAQRNHQLIIVAVAASLLMAGLVLRATADLKLGVVWILVAALAALAGFGMPLLAYLATAFDGSSVSRERDEVVTALEEDNAGYDDLHDECDVTIGSAATDSQLLKNDVEPTLRRALQERLIQAQPEYTLLRLLGGLPTVQLIADQAHGAVLSTGIPGAPTLDIKPLSEQLAVLDSLDGSREALASQLRHLPVHPWSVALQNAQLT